MHAICLGRVTIRSANLDAPQPVGIRRIDPLTRKGVGDQCVEVVHEHAREGSVVRIDVRSSGMEGPHGIAEKCFSRVEYVKVCVCCGSRRNGSFCLLSFRRSHISKSF